VGVRKQSGPIALLNFPFSGAPGGVLQCGQPTPHDTYRRLWWILKKDYLMTLFDGTRLTNKEDRQSNLSRAAMMNRWRTRLAKFSSIFLRLALGSSFLSAVADRFGLWGAYGHPNVGWGSYARFVDYTAKLNWFLPAAMIPALAAIATAAETLFGLLLVLSWKTRITALLVEFL
jgi:uncharacterized membrane protein YphA (DoxX/SURF4 family)